MVTSTVVSLAELSWNLEMKHLQEQAGLTLCMFGLCLLQKWPQPNPVSSQYYTHPTL